MIPSPGSLIDLHPRDPLMGRTDLDNAFVVSDLAQVGLILGVQLRPSSPEHHQQHRWLSE
jgi:hypothetical protein